MTRTFGVVFAILVPLSASASPADVAKSLREHYQAGQRNAADAVIASEPSAHAWDQQDVVKVTCTFRSRAEGLTFELERRPGVKGPLVIALRPGIVALPDRARLRSSGIPQDLVLLRAPVVELAATVQRASVQVPVACASFRRRGPQTAQPYHPQRAKLNSAIDRLASVLCAGSTLAPTPETALAVWIAHEGLTANRLSAGSFHTFPTPRQLVRPTHNGGAAKLIRKAGLNPKAYPYFGGAQPKAKAKGESKAKPKPEPKPSKPKSKQGISS